MEIAYHRTLHTEQVIFSNFSLVGFRSEAPMSLFLVCYIVQRLDLEGDFACVLHNTIDGLERSRANQIWKPAAAQH